MYKAKQEFLWYKKDDEISQEDECHCQSWLKEQLVELVKPGKEQKKAEEVPEEYNPLDVNQDGKVDAKDVVAVAKEALKGRKRGKR